MDTPYVSDAAAALALEFEGRFLKLPQGVGILFASVEPVPIVGGDSKTFDIRIGISRRHGTRTGKLLIQQVMQKELTEKKYEIRGAAFRGQRVG